MSGVGCSSARDFVEIIIVSVFGGLEVTNQDLVQFVTTTKSASIKIEDLSLLSTSINKDVSSPNIRI